VTPASTLYRSLSSASGSKSWCMELITLAAGVAPSAAWLRHDHSGFESFAEHSAAIVHVEWETHHEIIDCSSVDHKRSMAWVDNQMCATYYVCNLQSASPGCPWLQCQLLDAGGDGNRFAALAIPPAAQPEELRGLWPT